MEHKISGEEQVGENKSLDLVTQQGSLPRQNLARTSYIVHCTCGFKAIGDNSADALRSWIWHAADARANEQ